MCATSPAGETQSEGGFKAGKVSSAALLDVQEATDKSGKPYYKFEILTRTGSGRCFRLPGRAMRGLLFVSVVLMCLWMRLWGCLRA